MTKLRVWFPYNYQ